VCERQREREREKERESEKHRESYRVWTSRTGCQGTLPCLVC